MYKGNIESTFKTSTQFETLTKRDKREKKFGATTCTSMVCSTTTYEGPLLLSYFPCRVSSYCLGQGHLNIAKNFNFLIFLHAKSSWIRSIDTFHYNKWGILWLRKCDWGWLVTTRCHIWPGLDLWCSWSAELLDSWGRGAEFIYMTCNHITLQHLANVPYTMYGNDVCLHRERLGTCLTNAQSYVAVTSLFESYSLVTFWTWSSFSFLGQLLKV